MTPDRWRQIEALYQTAQKCDAAERVALFDRADPEIRPLVERMLAQNSGSHILNQPLADLHHDASETFPGPGTRLGPYRIEGQIGAGGMGTVYRAIDTRLDRVVAIKIAAERYSERFQIEARIISTLNHPHICILLDVGPDYLVMEFLEGSTLADEIAKGPLVQERVVRYGSQIASALAEAHAHDIIHRDLKPGNVMITRHGVKVLDFGLAKIFSNTGITETNAIMGTPAYMAPEQLQGKECDARTDIYALGLVLAEMATGKRTIPGGRLQLDSLPEKLGHVIERCLAENPEDRWQNARDVKAELEWAAKAAPPAALEPQSSRWRRALPWVLAGTATAGLALFAGYRGSDRKTVLAEPVRFEIPLPTETRFTASFALSPDGRKLGFQAVGSDGTPRIWIRDLNSLEMHPLAGTDSVGSLLIWSPDSQSVAFDSGGKLQRVNLSGGYPETLCKLDRVVLSGSWNRDGVILFGGVGGPLMRVSTEGGVATPVTALDAAHGDVAHLNPYFLPDGRHFVYVREMGTSEDISVGSLDVKAGEQDSRRLIQGAIGPMYIPSAGRDDGQLLFVRGTALLAQRFDTRRLTLSGDPLRVVDASVGIFIDTGFYSVADNGTLVYRAPENPQDQLAWFDEKGKLLTTVGPPGSYAAMALSPDGARAIVTEQGASANDSVWSIDTSSGTKAPLANDPATGHSQGALSPDGRKMILDVEHSGQMTDLYERSIDEAGDGALLFHSDKVKRALSWSKDGFVLFNVVGKGFELWGLPVREPQKAAQLLKSGPNYRDAQFSPDGRWVAYESDESSRSDIYVRSFSEGQLGDGGGVSPNGGFSPRWLKDEKQLLYLSLDNRLMKIKLTLGTSVQAGAPTELFPTPHSYYWAPSPDGKRFLFLVPQQQQNTPLTVVLNWQAGLKN